jgi:peptide/nickel transport system substrate-binding protein
MKRTSSTALILALVVLGAGFGVVLLQLDSVEKQLIAQNQQLRALGEAGERTAVELSRLKLGAQPTAASPHDECQVEHPLHPEVPDFLQPSDDIYPPPDAPIDGQLKVGWPSGDPKTLNPLTSNAAELTEWVSNYVDGSPAMRNRWGDPEKWHGDLACRIEVTDDSREYTIYLRKGVKWHVPSGLDLSNPKYAWLKGDHLLTAHDFVFTLDLMLNPQLENGFGKSYYEDLESWKALDDTTLVVRWKKRTFQSTSATLSIAPVPKFLYGHAEDGSEYSKETVGLKVNQHWYGNKGYVGVGPYRFSKYEPGRVIELERNEDYYRTKPAIARVSYPIYTDQNQTVLRLKAKEIDLGQLRAGAYREEFLQWQSRPKSEWPSDNPFLNGQIHCQVVDAPTYDYLGWNQNKPLFADAKVRTAMTLALRRREIIDQVFVGLGDVGVGPFLPETGFHDPSIEPLEFDLDRAKKLLTEAGWVDTDADGLVDKVIDGKRTPFEFTLLVYGASPEHNSMANIFKDDLLKIGVRLKLDPIEWSLMQKKMDEKQFDAFTGAWNLPWDTDPFQVWHSSQADTPKGSNRVGFRSKEADALIEQARATMDREQRQTLLRRVHRIIYDAQAVTFVRRRKIPYCWTDAVKGVRFGKMRPVAEYMSWYVSPTR